MLAIGIAPQVAASTTLAGLSEPSAPAIDACAATSGGV